MESSANALEEIRYLRRTMRDLVALSTLPAVWIGLGPEGIARSLADVLLHSLSLDLVYVRLGEFAGEGKVEVVRSKHGAESAGIEAVRKAIAPVLKADQTDSPATIVAPFGKGTLNVAVTRFGVGDDRGILVTGSSSPDFPTEQDRVLLGVGANQTAIVVQRRQTEERLHEQQEWLRVTLASIGDAVIATDIEGHVTFLNSVAEELTGWTPGDAHGKPLETVFTLHDEQTGQPVEPPVEKVLREGATVGLADHTVVIAKDGTERSVDDSAAPIRDAAGTMIGVVLILRDITERKRVEQHRNARLAVTHVLNQARSVQEAASGVLQAVCESLGWDVGFFWIVDAQKQTLACRHSWHRPDVPVTALETSSRDRTFRLGEGLPGSVWASREPAWLLDVTQHSTFPRAASAAQEGLHSVFACPIIVGDRLLGVIEFFTKRIREADRGLLEMMATMTGAVGQFMERTQAEEGLRENEEKLRLLADTIPQLAWMARPDGHIFWYNRRWYEYTGMTLEQTEGWAWRAVHDPEVLPKVLKRWQGALVSGKPFEMVFPLKGADGDFRPFLTRVNPLRDENGGILYWFGTNTDISDIKRMEEALRDADRRKDEFLATLAHELRNPLAPIRTGLEVLKLAKDDPATVEETRLTMERQTQQLVTLVDDLLDVSRITRGRLELRKCRVKLSDVLQSAVEASRPLIGEAGHDLTIAVPEPPVYLNADPHRLAQVISNLLNNAAKYTPEEGQIRLVAERCGSDVVVSVKDNGIGIPADMLDRIFEMFAQIDAPVETACTGLGIGLTLVKSLVEMHGGSIEVQSDGRNRGTDFRVRLPILAETPVGERKPVQPREISTASNRRRVLVVDDNKSAADMLSTVVSMLGNEVRTAGDGQRGIEVAAEFLPDVILMDLGMPTLNGYEAARRIRQQPWGKKVMLVALTGWGQDEVKQRTKDAGFNYHLVKPAEPAELQKLLAMVEAPEP